MRVLVTGGLGFLGSYVARHLVAGGHEVLIADRLSYAGKVRNIAAILGQVKLLIGDLADGDFAGRCAATFPDWVVHLAAETHVDRAIADPERFMTSNVLGTTRLLQALAQTWRPAWHQKCIVYSTDEVYGPTPEGVWFAEDAPFKPSNAYSASKVGVEGVAHAFWVTHRLPLVVVRPCNTYGPGQHPEKVIPKFVRQCLADEPLTVYNDGRGARDWLHVDDHARAIATLLHHGVPGEAYNLAAGEEHPDIEIATRIAELCTGQALAVDPSGLPIRYQPGRPGHDRRYMMDGSKLRALGWAPRRGFDEAFAETVVWCRTHADWWEHDLVRVPGREEVTFYG